MKDARQKLRAKTSRAVESARRDQIKNAARLWRYESERRLIAMQHQRAGVQL